MKNQSKSKINKKAGQDTKPGVGQWSRFGHPSIGQTIVLFIVNLKEMINRCIP